MPVAFVAVVAAFAAVVGVVVSFDQTLLVLQTAVVAVD